MTKQATQEISLSVGALEDIAKQIAQKDTEIAAATGSEAQIKKAFVDQVIAENADAVNATLVKVLAQLKSLDTNILVGLTSRLEDSLKTEFATVIDAYVAENVQDTAKVSEEDLGKLKEARKTLVETDKAIRTILGSVGMDTSSVPEPKRGGGRPAGSGSSAPKTGKNKENYQFTMDGKDRPASQNTFSSLAYYATIGIPKALNIEGAKDDDRWGAKQLKEFLASNDVNFGADDTWEVTLPNTRKIGARRLPATEATAEVEAPVQEPVPVG